MDVKAFGCDLCRLHFGSKNDEVSHIKGKKHIKMVQQQNDCKCGIYITDFSCNQTKEEALQYFSKFGGIKKSIVGPTMSYMIIVYENEVEATKVLSEEHFLDGAKLKVQKSRPKMNFSIPSCNDDEVHKKLLQMLKSKRKFGDQITVFLNFMTPNLLKISATYDKVLRDLYSTLAYRGQFSKFDVYNFGSSFTQLQFNSSDLDIYVDIHETKNCEKTRFQIMKSALVKSPHFHKIIAIPSAKIPIVKGIHKYTDMKCDINIKNMLGVENSKLISYYLSLDDKLRPVMLIIKYWAKVQEISGRNHLFTSYSMVMMFIFFLQKHYLFPSVCSLQNNTNPTNSKFIWNTNIQPITDFSILSKIRSESMLDILKGFFYYYSNFDFESHIICPYLGETVQKCYFSDITTVPQQFALYIKNNEVIQPLKYDNPVCLQDPFELNVNTCTIIFKNILERYITACSYAFEILCNTEESNMLINILSAIKLEFKPSKKDIGPISICLKIPKNQASDDFSLETCFQQTMDYCCTIFENIFRLDLEESYKRARVCNEKNVDSNIRKFRALSYVNMWDSRKVHEKALKDKLNDSKTCLERETIVSNHIWEINEKIRPSTPLFECTIVLSCLENTQSVNIELIQTNSYKQMFKAFATYASNKIPHWFSLHTQEVSKITCTDFKV